MGGSECNSTCESKWTIYLDQPLKKPIPQTLKIGDDGPKTWSFVEKEEQEEEETLSMVSDASLGPPYIASSPVFSFPKVKFKEKISLSFHVFL
ncbi:hypothetical protein AMTRI_Chr12g269810 [Amborella trichopoda]